MTRLTPFLLFLAFIFNGCIIADELFIPPPPEKEKSLQERSEDAVEKYIADQAREFIYTPFGFSEITIYKPIELLELEKLEAEAKANPDQDYDSLILKKKQIIKQYKIERTIKIDHFYTLEDSLGRITVLEDAFTLNDTLGVKDLSSLILLEIPKAYEDVLVYYFYEYTIFLSTTYEASRQLSKDFYHYFKIHLEELETSKDRSAFLWHVLQLCYEVKQTGTFDQQVILEKLVKRYINEERNDIQDYRPLEFSTLQQTNDETDAVLNYYFFHKFIGCYGTEIDTNVIMIEFTPYYELGPIYQMERPFDTYFK